MIQRSYHDSKYGKLYLVPTPIGNLEDITIRAIDLLNMVDKIYAEDTRVSSVLLHHFDIYKEVESCHKYTEEKHKRQIIKELKSGMDIAYMSDRGTPMISDPGSVLVTYAIANDIDVIALPGACAFLPALNMSGIDSDKFIFYGFMSNKQSERLSELKTLIHTPFTIIFYEAPHRITDTLKDIYKVFGERNISICREITKLHEEIFRGTISEAIEYSKNIKGEIVIVVDGYEGNLENINYKEKVIDLVNKGYKVSSAIKEIANLYGISKNDLYDECGDLF